jgi:uncharacterized membrane protein YdbT with pleckstrin-like domain
MQQPGGPQNQQVPRAQPPAGSSAQPGHDELIYEGIARHTASAWGYIKWTLASIAGGFGAYLLGLIGDPFTSWPLWILSFVGIPGLVWTFLRHITTKYKITLRRVEFEHGVIAKNVDSLELWRVLDVRYSAGVLDRMLGNATITLIGTDKTDPELHLYGLPNARQLFERLRDAVQAARHTSRPMELVGQDGALEHVGMDHQ